MYLTEIQRLQLADLAKEKAERLRKAGQNEPAYLLIMEEKAQDFEYLAQRLMQGF